MENVLKFCVTFSILGSLILLNIVKPSPLYEYIFILLCLSAQDLHHVQCQNYSSRYLSQKNLRLCMLGVATSLGNRNFYMVNLITLVYLAEECCLVTWTSKSSKASCLVNLFYCLSLTCFSSMLTIFLLGSLFDRDYARTIPYAPDTLKTNIFDQLLWQRRQMLKKKKKTYQ